MEYLWIFPVVFVVLFSGCTLNTGAVDEEEEAYVGETATGFVNFTVSDWSYSVNGTFNFTLKNEMDFQVVINSIKFVSGGKTVSDGTTNIMIVGNSTKYSVPRLPMKEAGRPYSVDVEILFTLQGQTKVNSGVVTGRVS